VASIGQTTFELLYQISPIILYQGIAQNIPGGYLPLLTFTETINLTATLAQVDINTYQFFANYKPLPGSTLLDFDIAEYPFMNLQMAANAVVQKPLQISMLMMCPAQNGFGYPLKLATLTALQTAIQNHVLLGGSFLVATPGYIYNNCLLRSLIDVTSPSDEKVQEVYQWNFEQPLITTTGSQSTLNKLIGKATNGLPTLPLWTGA
jgi:hypothetical protein